MNRTVSRSFTFCYKFYFMTLGITLAMMLWVIGAYAFIIALVESIALLPIMLLYLGYALAMYFTGLSKRMIWDNIYIFLFSFTFSLVTFVSALIIYTSDTYLPNWLYYLIAGICVILPPIGFTTYFAIRKHLGYYDPFEDDRDEDYGL